MLYAKDIISLTGLDSSTLLLLFFGCGLPEEDSCMTDLRFQECLAGCLAFGGVSGVLGSCFYFIFILLLQSSW